MKTENQSNEPASASGVASSDLLGLSRYRGKTEELVGMKIRGSNHESGVPEEGALIDDHSPPDTVHLRFVNDCGGIGNRGLADIEFCDDAIESAWNECDDVAFNDLDDEMKDFARRCFAAGFRRARDGKPRWPKKYRNWKRGSECQDAGWLHYSHNTEHTDASNE